MIRPKFAFLVISLVCFAQGISQEIPPIQNFSPSDYHAESQNWDLDQGDDKVIYVANNRGLLEYNGAKWTLYPSPNESIIRSLKIVGDRIYTGCYMEFGYWERNKFNVLEYTSLSSNLSDTILEDEEFWQILDFGERMVFQSHYRIYTYNLETNTASIIKSEAFIPKAFPIENTVYFQKLNEGVFKIENGQEHLVLADEILQNEEIINLFEENGSLMFLTRNKGFYKFEDNSLSKWETEASPLLDQISLYSGARLSNGNLALGTISHGLILMDSEGTIIQHIDQLKGLQNNTVLSLFEDLENNIWLGLDVGVTSVNATSPYHVYLDREGLVGSVYAAAVKNDILYLGTNQGLFYKTLTNDSDFTFMEGTEGQVWSLENIHGTLFCGHHNGTFIIQNTSISKIDGTQGTWKIGTLDNHPNRLIQGNYDGLYTLEKRNGNWELRNKINGFDNSSRQFEVFDNNIFVNHEYKGLYKLQLDDAFENVVQLNIDETIKSSNSGIVKYQDELIYGYKNGVLKYDWDNDKFNKDSFLSPLFEHDEYVSGKLINDAANNRLWTFTNSSIGYVSKDGLDGTPQINQIPLSEDMRDGIIGYESVEPISNGMYLIGARSGYFTIDLNAIQDQEFEVQLDKIALAGKNTGLANDSLLELTNAGDFDSDHNNLTVSFHAASYNKFQRPYYQYKLENIYDNWSNWSLDHEVTFENLPPGNYSFKVRAMVGDDLSKNTASYSFKIARPWYKSNLFILLYIISGVLGSIAIHSSYRRYYHRKQKKIIERNKRELELAKANSEKEIVKLKNQQLKDEFKSKSNELAASTMSIIKKNELLAKIKNQLVSDVEDKNSVKHIVNVIDKNLNQNDDWEMFKEAFNNADRKFLKKLKKAHPNLSPNDIRLCAYLRLNLSSKEIAPMFNISPRSVEIKRYRLRKKMDLQHDENLVDYILKL